MKNTQRTSRGSTRPGFSRTERREPEEPGLQVDEGKGIEPSQAAASPATPTPPQDFSRQTYLTVEETRVYLRFGSAWAVYAWADAYAIPKCRRGRVLLFLRRDLDEAVQMHRPGARGRRGSD